MTDLELLECAQSVYDFLIDDAGRREIRLNKSFYSFNEIPAFKKMSETLVKYGFTKLDVDMDPLVSDGLKKQAMVLFTLRINALFRVYEQNDFRELLRNNPKDFFSSSKSHKFYKIILRELKLKDLGI